MDAIGYVPNTFDLIWSEGAAYIIGLERALAEWKQYLKPGGKLVLTEICWLVDKPSPVPKKFWGESYPAMSTAHQARRIMLENGYKIIDEYLLPSSDWFDEYYNPLKIKHKQLSVNANETMKQAITLSRQEVELYERYGSEYGYVGFVLQA